MVPQPPFDSQRKEQQLAEALRITLEQYPTLQTLWLIVVQGLNKHVQIPHRDRIHGLDYWRRRFRHMTRSCGLRPFLGICPASIPPGSRLSRRQPEGYG